MIGIGGMRPPQHDTWIGAIAGGTVDAAKGLWHHGKTAVTGTVHLPGMETSCGGQKSYIPPQDIPVSRMAALHGMGSTIKMAYQQHTLGLRDPEAYKRWNDMVDKFQATAPRPQ